MIRNIQLEEYLDATTVHGFSYLRPGFSNKTKLFWSLVIATGFTLASVMIQKSLLDWNENQTITTIESIATPVQEVQFPTVTVCQNQKNRPDNWSFLEKLLNILDFGEILWKGHKDIAPANSEELRKDFASPILAKILEKLIGKYLKNDNLRLWSSQNVDGNIFIGFAVQVAEYVCQKKLNFGTIKKAFIQGFSRNIPNRYLFMKQNLTFVTHDDFDIKKCETKCCNNLLFNTKILYAILNAGDLMNSQDAMGFGNLLSYFAKEVTGMIHEGNVKIEYSTFDEYLEIYPDFGKYLCDQMTSLDLKLHEYFKDLGIPLGFQRNYSLSLFEIPSMLGPAMHSRKERMQYSKDIFAYSKCSLNRMSTSATFHQCFVNYWREYLKDGKIHPCDKSPFCCHFWTKSMNNNLRSIMQVMRMAIGRGKSHFNVTNFLQPYLKDSKYLKYPLNIDTIRKFYNNDLVEDKNSYIPWCKYVEENHFTSCDIFEPVLTDQGVCYSFNAEPIHSILQNSTFKDAFINAYESELKDSKQIKKSKGAGQNFALEFIINNGKYMKQKPEVWPLKVAISAFNGFYETASLSKNIRPGFVTVLSIQPMQIEATENLQFVPERARKCRFPHEIDQIEPHFFKTYSQISCTFECRVKLARKFCRCVPWNFPSFDNETICDLYGNICFNQQMNDVEIRSDCSRTDKCPLDCETVRFSIIEKEFPINADEFCSTERGKRLVMVYLQFPGFFNLVYDTWRLDGLRNDSEIKDHSVSEFLWDICQSMAKNDLSLVTVQLESDKFVKTVRDKRTSFTDKLSSIGEIRRYD